MQEFWTFLTFSLQCEQTRLKDTASGSGADASDGEWLVDSIHLGITKLHAILDDLARDEVIEHLLDSEQLTKPVSGTASEVDE